MSKRNWSDVLKDISGDAPSSLGNSSALQEHLRDEVIKKLSSNISEKLHAGRNNQTLISQEIDNALDAAIENSSRDGIDIDSELVEFLVELSGSLHAIESAWQRLISLTSI